MGKEIIQAVKKQEGIKIVCGFDLNENNEYDFPIYNNLSNITQKVDVIIDFSSPVATFEILKYATENKIPTVIATTGFSKEQLEEIKELSTKIPIFRSANMSLEINLVANVLQKIAKVLKESDIEITETHHNQKVDSPSGTAILLADAINQAFEEKKEYNFDRMQKREKRSKNEIGFSSIRGGNIVGEHTVQFFGENETLEITHRAYSRQVFAEGALKAAKFLVEQPTGLYNMEDLVK